jgi:hypothetical protein
MTASLSEDRAVHLVPRDVKYTILLRNARDGAAGGTVVCLFPIGEFPPDGRKAIACTPPIG